MVDEFCNSHFGFQEKRELFFPDHAVICRTCHKPRIKRLIDLHDFSIRHQNMICMFGRPHGGVPPAGAHGAAVVPPAGAPGAAVVPPAGVPGAAAIPPAGVPGAAAAIPPAGAPHGGAPGPALHGAHGPHINPLYATRVEFNAFRALVNQNMNQIQNQINNMQGNMQQLQNQLQGQINQLGQNIANTLGNINNNIVRINQRLGI